MKPSLIALSCLPLAIHAIILPVRQEKRRDPRLTKRDPFGVLQLGDTKDLLYTADISIAEKPFKVQLDTGSSDLWVVMNNQPSGPSPRDVLGEDTQLPLNITYAIGYAAGNIAKADVKFAGIEIKQQAYLAVTDVQNAVVDGNTMGILGLSFDSLSTVKQTVTKAGGQWGSSVLTNYWLQNLSEPNIITFMLQREQNHNKPSTGAFTIGEYVPQYASIANTPRIPTFPQHSPSEWTVLVDNIIANGKQVNLKSVVSGAPKGKCVGYLDTGTSFAFAPQDLVAQIYGDVPGATFSKSLSSWVVPCDAEVAVTMVIGGQPFDLHPLDVVQPSDSSGAVCLGAIRPNSGISNSDATYDLLLGDSILRSFYTEYNYGDFDSNRKRGDPYVRLLTVVNASDASVEYHQVRGGKVQNLYLKNHNSVNAASSESMPSSGSSGSSDLDDLKSKVEKIMKWAPAGLAFVAMNALVLLGVCICALVWCCRRRKSPSRSFVPLSGSAPGTQYQPVSLQNFPRDDSSHAFDTHKSGTSSRYD